jgi:hypothetical protein
MIRWRPGMRGRLQMAKERADDIRNAGRFATDKKCLLCKHWTNDPDNDTDLGGCRMDDDKDAVYSSHDTCECFEAEDPE